jgi:hypothetical protein
MPKDPLASEISRFSSEHPEGWGHEDWLGFLHHLSGSGIEVSDADAIGSALEHERLSRVLSGMEINGLGAKRIGGLANHFGTIWNLRTASAEEVAKASGISQAMAEQIFDVLR